MINHHQKGPPKKILVTTRLVIHPNKREEMLRIARLIVEPTKVEKGCLSFNLYQDITNLNAYAFVEEWESVADLEKYIKKSKYRMMFSIIELSSKPPVIQFNTVKQESGLEKIKSILHD